MTFRYGIIGNGAIGLGLAQLLSAQQCTMLSRHAITQIAQSTVFSAIDDNHRSIPIDAKVCSLVEVESAEFNNFDVLILPVKFYHLTALIQQLQGLIPDTLPLLLLQNGLGGHELLRQAFPNNPLFLASTTDAIAKTSPHQIHIHARGELVVGSLSEREPAPAIDSVIKTHPNAVWNHKILNYLYKKLAVNAVINPMTAKFLCRNGDIVQHSQMLEGLKQEVYGLYRVLELDINLTHLNDYIDSVIALTANNYSSMYQDVKHHRPTEIDSILGVLLTKAAAHKVPLPLIQSLYDEIKAL